MRRTTYKLFGLGCVAIGIIGAVLPLLPSTIFFIFAAGAFAKSSPELERRILEDPRIGPPVRAWQDHGVIPMKAKFFAFTGMAGGFLFFYWSTSPDLWLAIAVAIAIGGSALFVASRPSSIREEES